MLDLWIRASAGQGHRFRGDAWMSYLDQCQHQWGNKTTWADTVVGLDPGWIDRKAKAYRVCKNCGKIQWLEHGAWVEK
jgi:hypothetical protein